MKTFYFTGTGNSLYIAKKVGGDLYSIPQVLKGNQYVFEDEKIGIIFPTYGLSVPNIVKEFIEKITLISPYIFIIMTCGNNNGNATKWVKSFAKKHNINISYSNSIKMIGNHIPIANIDKEKSLDKNIEENINHLIDDINNNRKYINNGIIIGGLLRNILKTVNLFHPIDSPSNFSVNKNCIKCSTCIKVCPRANVSFNESKEIIFSNHCESCLSCVNNCPVKAIQVKGDKNPQARFRNEHVSLKEIINSNNH
ncbi:MAG: EFR1 family ferrodoxin [Turicibacter sp.]|nr:EFR1 family ferrodoxin [Turicibacter sp.]